MMKKPQEVTEYEKNEATLHRIRRKAYKQGKSGDTLIQCLRQTGLDKRYDEITTRQIELEQTSEYKAYKNQGASAKLKMAGTSIF